MNRPDLDIDAEHFPLYDGDLRLSSQRGTSNRPSYPVLVLGVALLALAFIVQKNKAWSGTTGVGCTPGCPRARLIALPPEGSEAWGCRSISRSLQMEPENNTKISEFLLLGISEVPSLQLFLFGVFLFLYLVTVFGNLLIILATIFDSHLYTPMYFFLSNLSFVDICFTSTTIPKMLVNIHTHNKIITYKGCIIQIYFFILFGVLDNFLLTAMAYDRFVAICHPLNYTVIMNHKLCVLLVLVSWLTIVCLFYCTCLGVYFSSSAIHNSHSSATASVMYSVVTPMLNPFIYSLRNKDLKEALGKLFKK
ncbi:olfactory receptor 19-like [Octodon degus]|uniref:Olfactory receptor n=1 Tax=Octodon degus TaxID=10160 RepID=A0A6P6EK13_OCTDE|nr:olfactory receptor 19-like [Octodon degus]